MTEEIAPKKRTRIIVYAIIASIVLYMAGVYSGLYANKIIKEKTEQDIKILKQETKQDFRGMQSYINFLDANLKNMQFEQTFVETLTPGEKCKYSRISMNELVNQLRYYWARLPFRIEEYERYNKPTEEYLLLKQQYAHLSIRTWLLAKSQYSRCGKDIVHGLYFYSAECKDCIKQGEQLDKLNKMIAEFGKDSIMFPIDFTSNETIIKNLKEYYSLDSTPAIIINDKVFQGRLFLAEDLFNATG